MENTILIESFRVYAQVSQEQAAQLLETLIEEDRKEMILFLDPTDPASYLGVLLEKYYTPGLSDYMSVWDTECINGIRSIAMPRGAIRSYIGSLMRRFFLPRMESSAAERRAQTQNTEPAEKPPVRFQESRELTIVQFLKTKTPAQLEKELNEQLIGQPELTRAVADFLFYHVLRQLHPELPQRPLLISGPSGNGKTEVWRVASRLYGDLLPIRIIDGSGISCEGWSGNFKVSTYMDETITKGGILVVDEFDKLVKPRHNSRGENVSMDIQAEFLKLLEGEYSIEKERGNGELTSQKMGFVLVGAFEELREKKLRSKADAPRIGFCPEATVCTAKEVDTITDEDLIRYGVMPELVGRVAAKCTVAELDEQAYLQILRSPHSRVTQIEKVLSCYGAQTGDVLTEEDLRQLIAASKRNRTGVRWVSAQVEARLLAAIRENGLQPVRANAS